MGANSGLVLHIGFSFTKSLKVDNSSQCTNATGADLATNCRHLSFYGGRERSLSLNESLAITKKKCSVADLTSDSNCCSGSTAVTDDDDWKGTK